MVTKTAATTEQNARLELAGTKSAVASRHTRVRKVRHVLHRPGKVGNERNDGAHDTKDESAGSVLGQIVHHDGEREDVTGHDEDQEEQLASTEEFAAKATHQHFTGVGHVVHLGIGLFKLADNVTSVRCEDAEEDEDDDGTETVRRNTPRKGLYTHGTNPSAATADGRERIPSDTVSAIIAAPKFVSSDAHLNESNKSLTETAVTVIKRSQHGFRTKALVQAITYYQLMVLYLTSASPSSPNGSATAF